MWIDLSLKSKVSRKDRGWEISRSLLQMVTKRDFMVGFG